MDGFLLFLIVIFACCTMGIVSYSFLEYKKTYFEYIAKEKENAQKIPTESLKLEIEKQKTERLKIKADYREKHGTSLYD